MLKKTKEIASNLKSTISDMDNICLVLLNKPDRAECDTETFFKNNFSEQVSPTFQLRANE